MHALEWLFVLALALYTIVIWFHRFTGKLYTWMVLLFGIGLLADISGTILLCITASERWMWTLHTVSGLISLLIMTVHFFWAVTAIRMAGKSEFYFNRFSIYAWSLWLIAFITGIPR